MDVMFEVSRYLQVEYERVDYNQFFHSNVCHVCKSTDQESLSPCERCGMISYCCENHRVEDFPNHDDFCTALVDTMEETPLWSSRHYREKKWLRKQEKLMRKTFIMMTRGMRPVEEQMFLFAKKCFVCHQQETTYTCIKCLSISYCDDHRGALGEHMFYCRELAISLTLDIIFLENVAWKPIRIPFAGFPDSTKRCKNMNTFCLHYYKPQSENYNEYSHFDINHAAFTDYVSDPLTVCFGLKASDLSWNPGVNKTFLIHIIGANYVEKRNFPAWELFLHMLSEQQQELVIMMIGPDLKPEACEYTKLCSVCKAANKRLILEIIPKFYHNYSFHTTYTRPDVIVGFNIQFGRRIYVDNPWHDTILTIYRKTSRKCPLLLTAKTIPHAKKDIYKIQDVLHTSVYPINRFKNPYCSERPYRDYETGLVMYRNKFLIVYKNLRDIIEPPDTSSEAGTSNEPDPRISNEPGPGTSKEPGPGTSKEPGPDTSNKPGPDTSNKPSPDTSNESDPDTSNESNPDTSNEPGLHTSNKPGPDTSNESGPDISNESGPDTSNEPVSRINKEPVPDISKNPF